MVFKSAALKLGFRVCILSSDCRKLTAVKSLQLAHHFTNSPFSLLTARLTYRCAIALFMLANQLESHVASFKVLQSPPTCNFSQNPPTCNSPQSPPHVILHRIHHNLCVILHRIHSHVIILRRIHPQLYM